MIRIFLSYAKEDKDAVVRLYHQLKEKGYKPWLDDEDLLGGSVWQDAVVQAINESHVFVACLSERSVAKHGYVQEEYRRALKTFARKPPGSIYLIPVRLDECTIPNLRQAEYGLNLRDLQWVDLFRPDGFERLIKSLEHGFPGAHQNSQQEHEDNLSLAKDIGYGRLQSFLKVGDWKKADIETFSIMFRVALSVPRGHTLNSDDITAFTENLNTFPCTDLLTIDRLWLEYSSGRFGFSVQKQVYVDCGARLNGEYPGDKIWREFGERVGWRTNNGSLDHARLTFKSSAEKGHLPGLGALIGPTDGKYQKKYESLKKDPRATDDFKARVDACMRGFHTLLYRINTCEREFR